MAQVPSMPKLKLVMSLKYQYHDIKRDIQDPKTLTLVYQEVFIFRPDMLPYTQHSTPANFGTITR
jgi:hypothetical protein